MDEICEFVIRPLKIWPLRKPGKYNFLSLDGNSHNQNSLLEKFEKNLSSAIFGDERPLGPLLT